MRNKGSKPGWGGPAKGNGNGNGRAPPFQKGNKGGAGFRDLSKAEATAALRERLFDIAMGHSEYSTERNVVPALLGLDNKLNGMPTAVNVNVAADDLSGLDEAALNERRAQIERELAAAGLGAVAPSPKE